MSDDIKPGYTRVSEFCARYEDFGGIDPEVLKNKARIGTGVHKAIANSIEYIPFTLKEDEKGYYESWFKWYDRLKCDIKHVETRLYCDKFMLTGAIDGIVVFSDGTKCIVDWKVSASHNDVVWALKGAFYHHLVSSNNLCEISGRVIYVQLDKHGNMPSVREYIIDQKQKSLMVATIMCYRFEEKCKKSACAKSQYAVSL